MSTERGPPMGVMGHVGVGWVRKISLNIGYVGWGGSCMGLLSLFYYSCITPQLYLKLLSTKRET